MLKPLNRYLAISVSYKFDLANLLEFIEYHLLVGVQKIYLCNNDENSTITDRILRTYNGVVDNLHTATMFKGSHNRQASAHNYVLQFARRDKFKWLAMLDMDEFLYPVTANTMPEILSSYENCPALQINYACFGSSGHAHKQILQTNSYNRRAENNWKWNHLSKAIAQVDKIKDCTSHHYFNVNGKWMDEDRIPCNWVHPPKMKYLRINHYMCRSRQDYADKMLRGNPLGEKRDWKWFQWADRNEVYDQGMQRFVPRLRKALEANKHWYPSKGMIKLI